MSKPLRTRKGIAQFLTGRGFKTAEASLATWAARGGGPPYRKYGVSPLYDEDEALAWAEARLSKRVTTTSELEAA
jgi:hypothetical protein